MHGTLQSFAKAAPSHGARGSHSLPRTRGKGGACGPLHLVRGARSAVERSPKASTRSRKIGREAFQPGSLQRVTVVTSLSGTLGEWTVAKAPRRAHPLDDVPASLSPQSEVTRSFRATISGCPSGQRPDTTSSLRAKGPWLWSGVEPRLGHAVPGTPAPGTGDSARRQSAEASQTPEPMAFPHD